MIVCNCVRESRLPPDHLQQKSPASKEDRAFLFPVPIAEWRGAARVVSPDRSFCIGNERDRLGRSPLPWQGRHMRKRGRYRCRRGGVPVALLQRRGGVPRSPPAARRSRCIPEAPSEASGAKGGPIARLGPVLPFSFAAPRATGR